MPYSACYIQGSSGCFPDITIVSSGYNSRTSAILGAALT